MWQTHSHTIYIKLNNGKEREGDLKEFCFDMSKKGTKRDSKRASKRKKGHSFSISMHIFFVLSMIPKIRWYTHLVLF